MKVDGKRIFGRLISMFVIHHSPYQQGHRIPLILVQLYGEPILQRERNQDKPFGLWHVCRKANEQPQILPADTIVRGCLLAPTNQESKPNDAFVFDVADGDIFLRVRKLWKTV